MHNIIFTAVLLIFGSASASAQFYTITREKEICPEKTQKVAQDSLQKALSLEYASMLVKKDSIEVSSPTKACKGESDQKSNNKTSSIIGQHKRLHRNTASLPELTIPNLYQEIIRNGILYPKIVLAQAILETGWFTSPLCRYRHNLFGLTNPRTGKYYEFGHWTESVRAYYTKVQYKYEPKNKESLSNADYLLWLHKIGYAEDPRYVREVIKVLSQL